MTPSRARRLAWALFVSAIVMKVAAVALVLAMPPHLGPADGLAFLLWTPGVLAFAIVGALVAGRHPGNPVGWLFLGVGVVEPAFVLAEQYARMGTTVAPGSLPAAALVGILGATASTGVLVATLLTMLLFPTGRLPSRRWRPVLALVIAWLVAVVVTTLVSAGPISDVLDWPNPLAAPGWLGDVAAGVRSVMDMVGGFLVLVTAPALIARWRSSEGQERAQLTWLVYAIVVLLVTVVVILPIWELGLLGEVTPTVDATFTVLLVGAVAGVPIAAGIAILRYRLFEIDVVIRRTVTYAAVVVVLAVAYVGLILGSQALLIGVTGSETLPVALSTLATAALFGPVRARVRAAVDRRFFRSRYDAQRTLEGFANRLRDEVELDAVGAALVRTVARSVQPGGASVWVRDRPS